MVIQSIKNLLHDIYYGTIYRVMPRHQYHKVPTGLKPNYYEVETRMLHGMFTLLKEYVEIELATLQQWNLGEDDAWEGEGRTEGLNCLAWQKELVHNEDDGTYPTEKYYGKPTPQAIAAKEIEELYLWWEDTRPARKDPYDDVEFEDYENSEDLTPAQKKKRRALYNKADKLERKYMKEDTDMLIRLVKIRYNLWT